MKNSKYIKKVTANSYCDLMKIIYNEGDEIRDNFVFRGLEDSSYDLIPSALRNKDNKLNDFIGNDFILSEEMSVEDAINKGFIDRNDVSKELKDIIIKRDKTGEITDSDKDNIVCKDGYLQVKKELYIYCLNF